MQENFKGKRYYQQERIKSIKKTAQSIAKDWPEYSRKAISYLRGYLENLRIFKKENEKKLLLFKKEEKTRANLEKAVLEEIKTISEGGELASIVLKKIQQISEINETDSEQIGRVKLEAAEELEKEVLELLQYHTKEYEKTKKREKLDKKLTETLEEEVKELERINQGQYRKFKS